MTDVTPAEILNAGASCRGSPGVTPNLAAEWPLLPVNIWFARYGVEEDMGIYVVIRIYPVLSDEVWLVS